MLRFTGQCCWPAQGLSALSGDYVNQASRVARFLCLESLEVVTQGFVHICPVLPTQAALPVTATAFHDCFILSSSAVAKSVGLHASCAASMHPCFQSLPFNILTHIAAGTALW